MKLAGPEARRFCTAPAHDCIGALLTGPDAGQVAAARRDLVSALMQGKIDDLRLSHLDATAARRDAAAIDEAIRARGFFPGRRVVVIEGGTDGLAKTLTTALDGVTPEDAFVIVTADLLAGRSSLRRLFEGHGVLACLNLRPEPPRPDEIAAALAGRGCGAGLMADAAQCLAGIARDMDHGSFGRLLDSLALYGADATEPLGEAAVLALAPAGLDAEVDRFVEAVADGRPADLAPLLRRLHAGGATPVGLLLALQRHFRALLLVGTGEGGPQAGLARVRPPLWGHRRDVFVRQLRRWRVDRLEQACRLLFETDSRIRSSSAAPDHAMLERSALRLAMMARR